MFGKSSLHDGVEIKNLGIKNMTITGGDDSYHVGALGGEVYHGIAMNCYSDGEISCAGINVGGLVGLLRRGSSVSNCYSMSTVVGKSSVGGLVGFNDGEVSNSYSTGIVIGDYEVGGLLGWNWSNGDAANCYSISSVNGNSNIGGLCGFNNSGNITNCHTIGTTSGYNYVGGLCGNNVGDLTDCYVNGQVSGNDHIGGLCGNNHNDLTNCYAICSVSGNNWVGGLCGGNDGGDLTSCYASGEVSGNDNVGGLCGMNSDPFTNCYATNIISGDNKVGGLCGTNLYSGILTNCYATGTVNGTGNYIGALCGYNDSGTFIASFWDIETSGTSDGVGNENPDPAGVEGKTTTEMQTQSTFTGWDFDPDDGDPADWMMLRAGEDYPRLAWQEIFDGDIAGLYGVDMVDFARLAGQWGEPTCNDLNDWCQGADIDHVNGVDIKDLAAVAKDWLK